MFLYKVSTIDSRLFRLSPVTIKAIAVKYLLSFSYYKSYTYQFENYTQMNFYTSNLYKSLKKKLNFY